MAYYKDLREYMDALEEKGKLVRMSQPINKDTELHPLVRLQFRGLPEEERKTFYFDNVYDAQGKKYSIPVVIAALGASPQVYSVGMMCEVEEIGQKWQQAMANPIEPVIVEEGPVQEVVLTGDSLLERGGLDEFPIPLSTPGWDVAPYITSPYWITKDPETGVRNMGTYRAQLKSPTTTGLYVAKCFRGIGYHWRKARSMGKPLEAAVVIGASPNIGYTSVSQMPTDVDELTVAGGIAGEPVELVKCKTVDLEVPAHAEIVLEGEISTEELEPEAPFGEATGIVGQGEMGLIFTIKCITHRREPIWQAFLSQFPPSESSVIRQIACANLIPGRMRNELNMPFIRQAGVHFTNGSDRYVVLQVDKDTDKAEVWRALEAMPVTFPAFSKVVVAVDEDIDPQNANLVNWAITFRSQPHRDVRIVKIHAPDDQDYSLEPPTPEAHPCVALMTQEQMPEVSCLLIDATVKWPSPPVSLPKKEFMDRAIKMWQEAGLPSLSLQEPWYGYSLGFWSEDSEQMARLAVKGEYHEIGRMQAQRRKAVE